MSTINLYHNFQGHCHFFPRPALFIPRQSFIMKYQKMWREDSDTLRLWEPFPRPPTVVKLTYHYISSSIINQSYIRGPSVWRLICCVLYIVIWVYLPAFHLGQYQWHGDIPSGVDGPYITDRPIHSKKRKTAGDAQSTVALLQFWC